jgi:hypothetical protein
VLIQKSKLLIIEAGLFASKDKDKCRSNGVRILGYIFQSMTKAWVDQEMNGIVKEIIQTLM